MNNWFEILNWGYWELFEVAPAYREGEVFSSAEFEAALRAALEPPSAGVVFWSWDHIEADPERAEIIRRVVNPTVNIQ